MSLDDRRSMRTFVIVLSALCSVGIVLLLLMARPYLPELRRFVWWRMSFGTVDVGDIKSGDATIHYRIAGIGEPLVLLHGGLSSSLDWYAQLPALTRDFRVISIDSRGHGQSTLGEQPLSYQLLAEDVFNVLDSLSVEKFSVAGWSDGGNTALIMALNNPHRIKHLVAISANANLDGLTAQAIDEIGGIDPEMPPLLLRVLYFLQSPHPSRLVTLRRSVLAMWQSGPHFTCLQLSTISAPVLLMIGQYDDVAREHADDMQECLGNARLEVLSGVGHQVPQSAPNRVLQFMLDFLARPSG